MLTFPLLKLSYATDLAGVTTNFSWTHTQHDLHVVFDRFRSKSDFMAMKVFQGARLLEGFNIEEKAREATEAIEWSKRSGIDLRFEQLPISAIVRAPLLAIRYTLPDKKIRRIQLKFSCEQHFEQALGIIDQLCISVSRGNSPGDAPSANKESSKGTNASVVQNPSGLHEGQANTAKGSDLARTSIIQQRGQPSTDRTAPQKVLLDNQTYSDTITVHHSQAHTQPLDNPSHTSRTAAFPYQWNYSRRLADGASSKQSVLSQEELLSSIVPQSDGNSDVPQLLSNTNAVHVHHTSPISSELHNFTKLTLPNQPGQNKDTGFINASEPSMVGNGRDAILGQLQLPPRRELPFKRRATESRKQRQLERAVSLITDTAGSMSRIFTGSEVPLNNTSVNDAPPNLLNKESIAISAISRPPVPTYPWNKAEQRVRDQPDRPSSFNACLRRQGVSIPQSTMCTPQTLHAEPMELIPASVTPELLAFDRLATRIISDAASGALSHDLEGWAQRRQADRLEIINDFIVQHIQDDDFLELCEDMEASWRRVVFELDSKNATETPDAGIRSVKP